MNQQLILVDCDKETLEKENEELWYKVNNLENYDENRLKEFRNRVWVCLFVCLCLTVRRHKKGHFAPFNVKVRKSF